MALNCRKVWKPKNATCLTQWHWVMLVNWCWEVTWPLALKTAGISTVVVCATLLLRTNKFFRKAKETKLELPASLSDFKMILRGVVQRFLSFLFLFFKMPLQTKITSLACEMWTWEDHCRCGVRVYISSQELGESRPHLWNKFRFVALDQIDT